MVRRAGACLALLGFAASTLAGTWVGNPATVVLPRALWVMLACFVVGAAAGWIAERVIQERVSQRKEELLASLEPALETEGQTDGKEEEQAVADSGAKSAAA
jgi:branched-subunit amino acid ABC-type transport system permease component